MSRRVNIDDAPFVFGIEGEHVAYQPDEPIDERPADGAAATERQTRAAAFFWEVLAFPGLTDQQRLVGLAKHFLLLYGQDEGAHATARFLGWDPVTGPPKVAEQWKRLTARLNTGTMIGDEWRKTPIAPGDEPAAA